jgi:gentisate 1,2-dioxygenase
MVADERTETLRLAWRAAHLVPLWESPTAHKPPNLPEQAHIWPWETIRPLAEGAIALANPAAVERRVLSLVNPRSKSIEDESTVRTLSAAIQILLPGESARPHRHAMNALRFVLEGNGALTVVDGKPCAMHYGDLILTPAWCWHEHVHRGTDPMIWLDALDVPLHLYLGTAKFQPGPVKDLPAMISDDVYAVPNIAPEMSPATVNHSPVFRYPYEAAAAAVSVAPVTLDGSRRVRYVNPTTGGCAMAFIDSHLVQIDALTNTRPVRSTSNAICCVVEGAGETQVGSEKISWQERDIFTLPQGNWITHRGASRTARLFVVSDRDLMKRLGLLEDEHDDSRTEPPSAR